MAIKTTNSKLAEALNIKRERPTLNVQEQSLPLKLFNWQCPEAQLESTNI